jgi:hypothetical protein
MKAPVATPSDLFSGGRNVGKWLSFILCEKLHENRESFLAPKLTLSDKQEVLRRKKILFYLFQESKTNVRVLICGKKQWAMMCPATLIY